MYRVVAGIDTYESGAGYKKIKIKPHIGGGLINVEANYQTDYGMIGSHWKSTGTELQFDVEIPANTTATIYIPAKDINAVKENNKSLATMNDIKITGNEKDYVVVELGSGKYSFTSQ